MSASKEIARSVEDVAALIALANDVLVRIAGDEGRTSTLDVILKTAALIQRQELITSLDTVALSIREIMDCIERIRKDGLPPYNGRP